MTFPGLVDLHVHGGGKFDTRTYDPSHIRQIAKIHGDAGTSAILPTIYSAPIPEMRKNMKAVREAMDQQSALTCSSHGKPGCPHAGSIHEAVILGVHLEGPFLNPIKCGAQDKKSFAKPTPSSLRKLLSGFEDIVKIMTIAPEIPGALGAIAHCRTLGIKANMGHSDATYEDAVNGKKAGATGITHFFNAMRPFHHREPGLAGLGLIDEDLYIEVIADGCHLHDVTLELIFNRKRLDRIILVSDSVKWTKGAKPALKGGILAGSGITLTESCKTLKAIGVPEAEIIEAAADNPQRYLALK